MPEATYELLSNAGLVSLCLVAFILAKNIESRIGIRAVQAIVGLAFGAVAAVMLLDPVRVGPGVQIDLRASMLFLAAFIGGPLSGLVAMAIVDAARFAVGGAGALPGMIAAALYVGIGLLIRHTWRSDGGRRLALHLGGGILMLTVVVTATVFVADPAAGAGFLREVLPSYLGVLALTVLSFGFLLQQEVGHFALMRELSAARDRAVRADNVKAAFLARMTHELRTPLNAILGFSELIKLRVPGSDLRKYVEYGDDIHRCGTHLLSLVNDVLDLSRLQNGHVELKETRLSLVAMADDVVRSLKPLVLQKRIAMEFEAGEVDEVVADERALRQIMLNLVGNALRYAPTGSTVTLMAWRHDGELRLGVRDRGPGISAEKRARLTEPFGAVDDKWVASAGQSGLGLPIVHSLAAAHGGGLFVADPDQGPGVIVGISLPEQRIVEPEQALAA
ncbi:ATP-binding protein [Desertibaculum subflavum]|uniref:ATP-binding protein n=1 Tax=Desertibaculum subflavum TaxID=2268458 RepID=UPI0013C4AA32